MNDITIEETTDISKVTKSVEEVLSLQLVAIGTQAEYTAAGEFLIKCKKTAKFVKDHYDLELKTAQKKKGEAEAERRAVVDKIQAFTDKLDHAERQVKNVMATFYATEERRRIQAEQKRRQEEEEKRLQTAIDTGHEEVLDKPIAVKKEEKPKAVGTYAVDVWEYQITDKSRINPDYLIPDEKAIGTLVRSQKERAAKILGPGVNVVCRKDIRARA